MMLRLASHDGTSSLQVTLGGLNEILKLPSGNSKPSAARSVGIAD